jgi:predicted negative regulator of RcsB-dependent stress response
LDTLGYVHHQMGDHQQAIAYYRQLLDHCVQVGDRHNEGAVLDTLGDVLLSAGDADGARKAWVRALPILEEIEHTEAGLLRAKITSLKHTGPVLARTVPAGTG